MLSPLKKTTQLERGYTCCLKLEDVQEGDYDVKLIWLIHDFFFITFMISVNSIHFNIYFSIQVLLLVKFKLEPLNNVDLTLI